LISGRVSVNFAWIDVCDDRRSPGRRGGLQNSVAIRSCMP
jgi:hypothetical protein